MSIFSYMDLSISHVTTSADEWLRMMAGRREAPLAVAQDGYGYWIIVPEECDSGVYASIVDVLEYARERGCSAVHLDRDAAVIDGLTVYDWG